MDPFADKNAYELNQVEPQPHSSTGGDFFHLLSTVQRGLSDYESKLDNLALSQHQSSDNMNTLTMDIRSITDSIKYQFSNLEEQVKKSDPDQIRQYNNALSRFRKLVLRESQLDSNYQHQLREKGVQEYQILNPNSTYEDALDAIDNYGSDNVLANPMLVEKAQYNQEMQDRLGEATTTFNEVKNRHQEMLKISEQVSQLNMLLQDMHELILEQDTLFDSAQDHYTSAERDFERGDANVMKARDHAKKGRKWRWILLACAILLILIIIGVVVGLVKGLH